MKKSLVLIGILVIYLLAVIPVLAEDAQANKTSAFLIIKNDYISPQKGKGYYSQAVAGYWHRKWLGLGGEVLYATRRDFLEIKAYATINKEPLYFLVGYQGNSLEQKYFQTGFWYLKKFEKTTFLLDVRNFWTANKVAVSYLEVWTNLYHSLSDRFYIGFENRYDHWWHGKKKHDLFMLGPLVGINITKRSSIYLRPSIIWDRIDGKTRRDIVVRLAWKFVF